MKLLWFKGAVGGRLFTAISHGRIGDVVKNESQPRVGEHWCSRHSGTAASNSLQLCFQAGPDTSYPINRCVFL